MTNEQHNKYVAWTFLGHAAFQLLMTAMMGVMFFMMFSFQLRPGDPGPPRGMFAFIFGFMFVFQMLFTAPSLIAAYGLLKKRSWARVASIVAAVMSSMNVPIGTAACVYALWFFMGDNWKEIYPQGSERNEREPLQLNAEQAARWTGYQTDEKGEPKFHTVEPPDWR